MDYDTEIERYYKPENFERSDEEYIEETCTCVDEERAKKTKHGTVDCKTKVEIL